MYWVVLANANCLLPTPWQWWQLLLQSFLKDSPLAALWFWDFHMLLFASPVTYTFRLSSFYCCRSEANTHCIVNKLLHLVCLFRKMCHVLFALKGSSYKYFKEHRWEKHACILLDYIFQTPSLFGGCESILFFWIYFVASQITLFFWACCLSFSMWVCHLYSQSESSMQFLSLPEMFHFTGHGWK